MRLAGTWMRYSNSAMPQLTSAATYHGELEKFFRWPYQAKVMNRLDTASISAVTSKGFEIRFIVQLANRPFARSLSKGKCRHVDWLTTNGLIDSQQFHVEHQRRVRWNHAAGTARAVAQLGRNDQRALTAHLHALHTLVPALDHHPGAEREA